MIKMKLTTDKLLMHYLLHNVQIIDSMTIDSTNKPYFGPLLIGHLENTAGIMPLLKKLPDLKAEELAFFLGKKYPEIELVKFDSHNYGMVCSWEFRYHGEIANEDGWTYSSTYINLLTGKFTIKQLYYLKSLHIDIFDAINEGLAIHDK